jgi:hypothetical protein
MPQASSNGSGRMLAHPVEVSAAAISKPMIAGNYLLAMPGA